MGDLINGGENQQRALKVYELSKACSENGGFNLRKWRTSDPELQSLIDEIETKQQPPKAETKFESDETSYAKTVTGGVEKVLGSWFEQKVLGLKWNYESDELLLTFDKLIELSKTMTPTKRNLLKLSASLLDPLGIVSPVSVRMKILLQETCKLHLELDTPLPETLVKAWCEILNDFEQIPCISIPRCYFDETNEEIEQYSLHAFGDTSKKAFCSVIYLVMKIASGYHRKLVTSKTRVVPLKEMSVPRLELIATLILARLLNNVKHSLESQILFESIYLAEVTAQLFCHG